MASSSRAGQSGPVSQNRLVDDHVLLGDLDISFRRTIRVPDNHQLSQLPPDLGPFPLFQVRDYASKLPVEMAAKGGLFMPMYQREAMWINFASTQEYAIKVYVGAVNAVSGEPAVETAATQLRRRNKLAQGQSIQDYVVVPDQMWLDGIATAVGQVRQFVATPMGSGQSIEAQITGEDVVGGIQFEITPRIRENSTDFLEPPVDGIFVEMLTDEDTTVEVQVALSWTIADLKARILGQSPSAAWQRAIENNSMFIWACEELEGMFSPSFQGDTLFLISSQTPASGTVAGTMLIYAKLMDGRSIALDVHGSQTVSELRAKIDQRVGCDGTVRLIFGGKRLQEERTLQYYNIKQHDTIDLIWRLAGGGGPPPETGDVPEMTLAPGGRIEQNIAKDPHRHADQLEDTQATRNSRNRQRGRSSATTAANTTKNSEFESGWDTTKTVTFNVQILNTSSFARITGLQPPETPVNAAEYAQHGLPFFKLPNEPATDVTGEFDGVQSVAQLEGTFDPVVNPKIHLVGHKMAATGPKSSLHSSSFPTSSGSPHAVPATTSNHTTLGGGTKPSVSSQPVPSTAKSSSFLKRISRRLTKKSPLHSIPPPPDRDHENHSPTAHPPQALHTHSQASASDAATQPALIPRMNHIPANTNLGADFFNPAGPRTTFRSVGDLEREMGRMATVRFR